MVFAGEILGQKCDWLSDIAFDDLFFEGFSTALICL